MPKKAVRTPIVHLYPARFPEDTIEIIGNRPGLERLINTLIDAVTVGTASGIVATSDGSTSEVRAVCLNAGRRPEDWRRSGSPYWDVEDPLVAKIVDLTADNRRLKSVVAGLRRALKSIKDEGGDRPGDADEGSPPGQVGG